jgi:RimJ/RimL family protein N-acetyltransferase
MVRVLAEHDFTLITRLRRARSAVTVTLFVEATASAPALRLRPWTGTDAEALVAAYRDPILRQWSAAPVDGEAAAHRWLAAQHEGWNTGSRHSFAVVEAGGTITGDGSPIGHVVLKALATDTISAEVGYWTSAPARGRGVAPRALEALSQWAFTLPREKPLERLELFHRTDNQASCRVALKSRFAFDCVMQAQPPVFPTEGHRHIRRRADCLQ